MILKKEKDDENTRRSRILENKGGKKDFAEWAREHSTVVEIFTLLAGADIEVLNILESEVRISDTDLFNTYFSEKSRSRIFWVSFF